MLAYLVQIGNYLPGLHAGDFPNLSGNIGQWNRGP